MVTRPAATSELNAIDVFFNSSGKRSKVEGIDRYFSPAMGTESGLQGLKVELTNTRKFTFLLNLKVRENYLKSKNDRKRDNGEGGTTQTKTNENREDGDDRINTCSFLHHLRNK